MKQVKIALNGANGRMGMAIKEILAHDSSTLLIAQITRQNPIIPHEADIIIDFSSQEGLQTLLKNASCKIISGTTGIDEETFALMQKYGKEKNGIIWGSNTSFGVNLMFAMVKKLGSLLGEEYDAEIYERHHRLKKDSPSGTALTIGKKIAEGRNTQFEIRTEQGERKLSTIGFGVERGGRTVGYHEARFIADDEVIWFGHEAFERSIFAKGAVKLAKILVEKDLKGYHEACDVLLN